MSERKLVGYRIKWIKGVEGNRFPVWLCHDNELPSQYCFDFQKKSVVTFKTRAVLYSRLTGLAKELEQYPNEDMNDIKIVRVYKRAKR
jgi:hypothetical protein